MSETEHRWEVMEYKYLLTVLKKSVLYLSEFFFYSWSLQLYTNIRTSYYFSLHCIGKTGLLLLCLTEPNAD